MISIAIDGPSGAGKSTLSRKISQELGYIYVDTGAMYRTIGLAALRCFKNTKSSEDMQALLPNTNIDLRYVNGEQRMFLNDEDVSDLIRTPEVSMAASEASAHGCVRDFLLEAQRALALKSNVLMDGRDIGTVILPNAEVKIYLTATAEDRAQRRYEELVQKGEKVVYSDVLSDVIKRDDNDMNRKTAPLRRAEDAILVDTTGNTFEKSYNLLLSVIKEKLNGVK